MAQPQQQPYQVAPQRPFSPQQAATSPPAPSQFALPPNKRQRLSPNPTSQPSSPYVQSPYAMSPGASPSAGASPHFAHVGLPNVYNTPYASNGNTTPNTAYGNGSTTPNLSHPQTQLHQPPQSSPLSNFPSQPGQLAHPHQQQSLQNQQSYAVNGQMSQQPPQNWNNYAMQPQGAAGTMGPPSKPVEKKDEGDATDVFHGTGIDLREEEQYTFQMYNTSFNSQLSGSQSGSISTGHSFTQFPPGSAATFYGAGPANNAESTSNKDQKQFEQDAADKAWHAAAHNLASSRQNEMKNPFVNPSVMHQRMFKLAHDNGLVLNLDKDKSMGTMKLPEQFPQSNVNVQTVAGPNGAMTATKGVFIPAESPLVDQLALLSIATKFRLRGLLEEATRLAKGRQNDSHGIVPAEWADVAAQNNATNVVPDDAPRNGWESAVSPLTNPLKRSPSSANIGAAPTSNGTKTADGSVKFSNEVVMALRNSAAKERDFEEARLRKRLARTNPDGTPRSGSVLPATPGSVAPDPDLKAPTKKEQKKKQEAKINEAANHESANATSSKFLGGGGGGGLFGKKKKYSWMTGGGSGSGTSTPAKIMTQGLPGTPGGSFSREPEKLTTEGARRLGTWREDHEKGRGVQLRDWITVLEEDGREKRALQQAYAVLDDSNPK